MTSIVHISDTHGKHAQLPKLPEADIIVHSGDLTWDGTVAEVRDFVDWYATLPYQHKIFIAGNHDTCLRNEETLDWLPSGVTFLCDSATMIDGILFHGIPFFPKDIKTGRYSQMIKNIPAETNVLITHQPPLGIMDGNRLENYGSKELKERVLQIQPTLHLFGHIHNAYGSIMQGKTIFSNGAVLDNTYKMSNAPQVFFVE